jgi:poly(hydroxyalkanoate) granule-associated protein
MATQKRVTKPRDEIDIARKIWLAGVGAYGRVFAETQGALEKLAGSAGETFDQLVASGEKTEDAVRARIAKSGDGIERIIGTVSRQVQDLREGRRMALDARIGQVRKTVTDTLAPFNVGALAKSVDKLSARVETLSAEVARLKGAKAKPARKKKG